MKKLQDWLKPRTGSSALQFALIVAVLTLFAFPNLSISGDKKYKIKAITAFPKNHAVLVAVVPELIKRVKEKSGGRLEINWIGGPEVVKGFDQAEALRSGMIDMVLYIPTSWMKSVLPIVDAKGLSEFTAPEERENGAYALWQDTFRTVNIEHLGFWSTSLKFQLYTVDKISNFDDLKGKTIRVMPLYAPFIKATGASPITMAPPELYTALQRKVVDGYIWLEFGSVTSGWNEVVNYMTTPVIFRGEATAAVNLDKFQKLPQDLQDLLHETMAEMELYDIEQMNRMVKEEKETMIKGGMEVIELPETDAKKFTTMSQDITWQTIIDRNPELGPKFRELTTK